MYHILNRHSQMMLNRDAERFSASVLCECEGKSVHGHITHSALIMSPSCLYFSLFDACVRVAGIMKMSTSRRNAGPARHNIILW